MLIRDDSRFVLHPIRYPEFWTAYKTAQSCFWRAEEVNLATDQVQWTSKLGPAERAFLSNVLAFFAVSDGIVNENLVERFCAEIQIPEARCFYGFQIMMENVHAEAYANMLTSLIEDVEEQARLTSAMSSIPTIAAKAAWAMHWITDPTKPFGERLVAFAAVEGIFFSSAFASIFWLRSRGIMPGLCHANELIARDENMHTNFACIVFKYLQYPPAAERVRAIVDEAVQLELQFFGDALPAPLDGMNQTMMAQYVHHVADKLLRDLGSGTVYNGANPFPFMESMLLDGKTNFFERKVSDYQLPTYRTSSDTIQDAGDTDL
ncbi:putative ribonucleoside-diphosphate reductase small chain B [Earliella scabrosa]|nr:putative ribonucleoside-diphosphate reductase small chain B [Earliella scabrosa]